MNIILAPFAWLLNAFNNLFNSYGLAIILFAVVLKVVLFPFALKGKRSMVKMTALQGQAQRIQKQYAANKVKQQEELQALYDREKVNPMSGCLWTMVPLLILIPLYAIIRQPLLHMMHLAADQIAELAKVLGWDTLAVGNGWITQDVVNKAVDAAKEAGTTYLSSFQNNGYNQLYLSSLITPETLPAAQAVAPGAFVINFDFLGLNLALRPQWQIWTQTLNWNNVGLFLMPIFSAVMAVIMSIVINKTNNMNNPDAPRNNNFFMTYLFSPIMSLWIGYAMPAGLCLYWIANSVLSMIQELIAAQLLKKDYEAAAEARRKQELLEKEEEKRTKELLRAERAKRAEEKKKGGKKKPAKETVPGVDVSASRVGLRAYARGRAYDPNRYGGVTPYRDPDQTVDEEAVEKAREAKAEKAAEAALEAEVTAKVAAEVEALGEGTAEEVAQRLEEVHAAEAAKRTADAEAEADALADSLKDAGQALDEAWDEVTAQPEATEDEISGDEDPKEE